MQNENLQPNNGRPLRRRSKPLQPFTAAEIELLKIKKFIDELELQRLFGFSERKMYTMIKKGKLQPSFLGSKKLFNLEKIYKELEENKGRGS